MRGWKQYSVSDLYFYSELLKSVGLKQTDEWLQHTALQRPSNGSTSPQLLPSTPVRMSAKQVADADSNADLIFSNITDCSAIQQQSTGHAQQHTTNLVTKQTHMLENTNKDWAARNETDSAFMGNLGLLFTDSAHCILEDSDVDILIQRLNSMHPIASCK